LISPMPLAAPYPSTTSRSIPIPFKANSHQPSAVSRQPSAISRQPSAVSHQPSAVSHQPSAISRQPSAVSLGATWLAQSCKERQVVKKISEDWCD
jgi:hypothetical protein